MNLEALIFDCDGVMAETEHDGHRVAFNRTFGIEGIDAYWDEQDYGRLIKIGGGKERMLAYFREKSDKYPEKLFTETYIAKLHAIKTEMFMQIAPSLPPRPGVRRLILEAYERGIDVFVCSTANERSVHAIAKSILGEEYGDIITEIFAGDIVPAKKPAPDIYLKIPEKYKIKVEGCFVVEDTYIGLTAAYKAGMRCLVTPSKYSMNDEFARAVAVVSNLGDKGISCGVISGLPKDLQMVTVDTLDELLAT